ncbi:MAG: methylmalonyl Co-A mutase-associated GTPase MeaB [Alphaproteobacteria bacterium]|nr:methylmalonyl Co-A mutase-associated GTPase MeaB [Alphaproteobacteria bacterium]
MTAAVDWRAALLRGDRLALSRAITAVENETAEAGAVLAAIFPHLGRALVVGFTGAPGAGKSSLVNAYIGVLRGRGLSVGVVAVDPSSPESGGALLGDRLRMNAHAGDPGVFVRSLAARGHLGGLSRTAARVIDVMDAAGREVIVVETVGTGQSEVEIGEVANVRVVVSAPGLGDDVQALKAGILEIADILVVNKADLPLAERAARQLEGMAALTGRAVPVLKTVATTGAGIEALAEVIAARAAARPQGLAPRLRMRRLMAGLAAELVRRRIADDECAALDGLAERLLRGEVTFAEAARKALEILSRESD